MTEGMSSELERALAEALDEARLGRAAGELSPLLTETCAALHRLEVRELRLRRLEAGLAAYDLLTEPPELLRERREVGREAHRLRELVAELRAHSQASADI